MLEKEHMNHLATLNDLNNIKLVSPGQFEGHHHYYQKVLNAQIHPMVRFLLNMGADRIVSRFCHLNPKVGATALMGLLLRSNKYFRWGGADLFNVTTAEGARQIVLIETNSCPSGQKSMPLRDEFDDQSGYRLVVENAFAPRIKSKSSEKGVLAVLYDKNFMEASGYAQALSDYFNENVYLVPYFNGEYNDGHIRIVEGFFEIQVDGNWKRVRAALRYVTQKPWNRIPVATKTLVFNPVISCLAGGRNKLVASKAYELFNAEIIDTGLKINVPYTVNDVSKTEIPLVIRSLGGRGVVKIPYSNAGQGVFTIVNESELNDFMERDIPYDQFIVQSLIGNATWSSSGPEGQFYHVGTIPNKKNKIFVTDIRFMVCSGKEGFKPVSLYARKAKSPLADELMDSAASWDMLGTNLSIKQGENSWGSDTDRLVLMDRKDFNSLGISLDDLISGYIQTVLAMIAIDRMAGNLLNSKGKLKEKLFHSINKDDSFISEIMKL